MSNETKTNRTQLTDLPVAEQEMTAEEMENVQGGRTYHESRSNQTKTDTATITVGTPKDFPTATPKTQTPL